jgi:hypothetical protein
MEHGEVGTSTTYFDANPPSYTIRFAINMIYHSTARPTAKDAATIEESVKEFGNISGAYTSMPWQCGTTRTASKLKRISEQ